MENREWDLLRERRQNGGQTPILSLGVVGCNDGNSSELAIALLLIF